MKTIKENGTERTERVSDNEAYSKVGSGRWNFCSKSEWKTNVRDANKKVATESAETPEKEKPSKKELKARKGK